MDTKEIAKELMKTIRTMDETQTNLVAACDRMADAMLEMVYKVKDLETRVRKLENKSKS